MMRRLSWVAYVVPTLALIATEAAFYASEGSRWRKYAGLFWVICSVAVILSAWFSSLGPFFRREFWALPNRWWYLTAFFLPPALLLLDGGGTYFTSVDGEGLQQLAAGIHFLRHDTSLGVFSMAYARYMDRQYLLNCLPAFFFGPSLWALRVGTSMFYIGSYLFFLSALATFLRKKGNTDALFFSSFCGVLIAFGHYALLNTRKFEQTMMPIGATLFFLAALLCFITRPGPLKFLWLTWALGFFTGCYTPALASWGLAILILSYFIIRKRQWVFALSILYGIVCAYIAYRVIVTTDAGSFEVQFMVGDGHLTPTDWILRYLKGIRSVVGTDYALFPAPLVLSILGGLYLGWRYRDHRYAVVCAWALAVAAVSLTVIGSNLNFPNHDIARALITVPPLALGAVLLAIRFISDSPEGRSAAAPIKFFLGASMVYMVFAGVCTVFLVRSFFGVAMMDDPDEAYGLIDKVLRDPTAARPTKFYMIPPMDIDLEWGLVYFAPNAKVVRGAPPKGEKIPGVYVFRYLKKKAEDRFDDEVAPDRHPRPFLALTKE
jgi:hypothetical protein